jgi:hypothetical protein
MSATALDAARLRGDPVADELVATLGDRAWPVVVLMRGVQGNREALPAALPVEARRFFAPEPAPAWLDPRRVQRAQRWAQEHLLHVTTALFCASLPSAYAAERGARVLAATERMRTDVDRRVNETARFVLAVLAPGSLESDGGGIRAIQKTRFVHALVRRTLAGQAGAGDRADRPINQEDLLGTLLGFSVIVIGAVRRLGVTVEPRAADDFFHLWRGVGALLGIEEPLLPPDFAAARQAAAMIGARQFRPSPHGRALMATLLARLEAHLPVLPDVPRLLVRHLLGERLAELLGVPPASEPPAAALALGRVLGRGRALGQGLLLQATPLLARPLLEAIVAAKLGRAPGVD